MNVCYNLSELRYSKPRTCILLYHVMFLVRCQYNYVMREVRRSIQASIYQLERS